MIPGLLGTLSGTGFILTDIPDAALILDGSTILGLSNADPVSSWSDLSGNGNDATQGTSLNQPTFQIVSGIKCVRFADAQFLQLDTRITNVRTVMAVEKWTNLTGQYRFWMGDPFTFDFHGANHDDLLFSTSNASASVYNGNGWINGVNTNVADMVRITSWNVITLVTTGNVAIGNLAWDEPDNLPSRNFLGDRAVIGVWNRALTSIERLSAQQYLGSRFGITIDQRPVNTVAPALSAAGWTVGQVASCDTGTWTNEPTSYAYQWQRKDGGYTDIPGATSSSYLLAAADAGKNVRCGVTPSNAFATGTVAYSLDSDLIL